jgi:Na+/H+ antiporter NhaD/arsenite permease-like protein
VLLVTRRPVDTTITFTQYLRVGLPVTLVTLAFGIWWLY